MKYMETDISGHEREEVLYLLAESIKGELEEDVVDIDGGATLGNGVKVVRYDLRLAYKHIASVICAKERGSGRKGWKRFVSVTFLLFSVASIFSFLF